MIRILIGAVSIVLLGAVELTETPAQWQLRDAQSNPTGSAYPSKEACIDAAKERATAAASTYRCTYAAVLEVKGVCDQPAPELPQDGTRKLWGEQDPKDDSVWHLFETTYVPAPWPECWKLGAGEIHVPPIMIESRDRYVPPLAPGALDGDHL